MEELHIVDKNDTVIFSYAKDKIKDSEDCKIIDKFGLKKIVLKVNLESKIKEKIIPFQVPKKRDLTEKKEDYI